MIAAHIADSPHPTKSPSNLRYLGACPHWWSVCERISMSENETSLQLDTRREELQKIHKSTTDLHNLGALKYEETKPTFLPFFRPKHATPQPLVPSAPPPTKKPKFLVFQTRKFCPVGSNMWTDQAINHGQVTIRLRRIKTCPNLEKRYSWDSLSTSAGGRAHWTCAAHETTKR